MKNWGLASALLVLGYLCGTVVGFETFYISVNAMWVATIVFMPVIFAYLCRYYLMKVHCEPAKEHGEMLRLIAYWIGVSFLLDCVTYILIMPFALNIKPDWNFFMEQSPWIWISYLVLFISGYAGKYLYGRKQALVTT